MIVVEKKRTLFKERMKSECVDCKGPTCSSCIKKCQMIDKLADANIPVIYWTLKMKDFIGPLNLKNITTDYISSLQGNYANGLGICFVGSYGTGKSTAGCAILKNALMHGYSAYYTTLTDMISYMMDFDTKSEFSSLTTRTDFLFIDEVDSRHFSSSDEAQKVFGSNFERVIRYRVQNQLPTIIASNNSSLEEVFSGQYSRVVESLTSSTVTVVPSLGKDIRKGAK